ncbi:MAG TPA: hypothetical protein VN783_01490 [Thermoanaerobaculia bacterium]|nr:hypothetical protein [Thermoanaerobaculia bacterium]
MSEPPRYELARLATIRTFTYLWEAQLARARLDSEGITAVIADEHLIRMDWMISNAIGGVKLQVAPDDASRAVEVLDGSTPLAPLHLVTEEDRDQPRCPGCRSAELFRERWSRGLFLFGALALGFPLPALRPRWVCRHCGATWKEADVSSAPDEIESDASKAAEPATVGAFDLLWEAELARGRLAADGIDACVFEDKLPAMNPWTGAVRPACRVQVRAADRERALEILADLGLDDESLAETGADRP